jgi:hypothetical protein
MKKVFFSALSVSILLSSCHSGSANSAANTGTGSSLPADSVKAIAKDAYVFGLAIALMDITAHKLTNVEAPVPGKAAPWNQFAIATDFPDAKFTAVVRPNADTYYSTAFLNLSAEPLVLTVPNTNGRYYLMPMLDAYSNVFASPGKRTTGTNADTFLIAGPAFSGTAPAGMKAIKAPTNLVWVLGRTQVNSPADGTNVVVPIEKKYTLTPLSAWGKPYVAPKGTVNPDLSTASPNDQAENMAIDSFFNYVNGLMVANPPKATDAPAMEQFAKIGVAPGAHFDLSVFDTATQAALKEIPKMVFAYMNEIITKGASKPVNGWVIFMKGMGNYNTDYNLRALIDFAGLGANLPEDAVYPSCSFDSAGNPLNGANKYVMHFEKGQTPPVDGFWSLTMYNQQGFFIENPLNRYAIGNRFPLKFNKDGSLDLYFQNVSPGKDKESNWLPAPAGQFNLMLRMYWPKQAMLNGSWTPPPVIKVG